MSQETVGSFQSSLFQIRGKTTTNFAAQLKVMEEPWNKIVRIPLGLAEALCQVQLLQYCTDKIYT